MRKLKGIIELFKYYYSFLNYDLAKIYLTRTSIDCASDWGC